MKKTSIEHKFATVVKHRLTNDLSIQDIKERLKADEHTDAFMISIGVKLTRKDIEKEYKDLTEKK